MYVACHPEEATLAVHVAWQTFRGPGLKGDQTWGFRGSSAATDSPMVQLMAQNSV